MATYYLINTIRVGTQMHFAGSVHDDANENLTLLTDAGGLLWPSTDATVAAAALVAQDAKRNGGADERRLDAIMQAAVDSVQKATDAANAANATSAKAFLYIPILSSSLAAGTPMAAFADNAGASAPGVALVDAKALGLRWNNFATQTPVWAHVALPQDLDPASPMVFHVLASKTGATLADATKFTIGAYAQVPAALHDAGANLGGDTTAMTGNAAAKTVQNVTLSVAVPPTPPAMLSVSIQPKDGTLGTDDVVVTGFWIEYKRKLLTS
jgi:hypothetical protein